ncbi:MAG TPA: hypothetical protein VF407_16390 [Polyangiaceae bacterium]
MKILVQDPVASAVDWPPSPHDPRERTLALRVEGWEVRLFEGRKFQYFVTHGLWHVQLWNPSARVSILTPSALTFDRYEAFPIAGWKKRADDYASLARLFAGRTDVKLPTRVQLASIERGLVHEVVRGANAALASVVS